MAEKNKFQYIMEPAFYKDFACKGGSCINNCCIGWGIFWDENEINAVKNADISDGLRELMEKSFEQMKDSPFSMSFCRIKNTAWRMPSPSGLWPRMRSFTHDSKKMQLQ